MVFPMIFARFARSLTGFLPNPPLRRGIVPMTLISSVFKFPLSQKMCLNDPHLK
jgi:hypothetical protein